MKRQSLFLATLLCLAVLFLLPSVALAAPASASTTGPKPGPRSGLAIRYKSSVPAAARRYSPDWIIAAKIYGVYPYIYN